MADKQGDSGSDTDSTEEPVVGNVNKFAVVPPNYSGKPRRGHLIFDACFESGNLGRVDYITETEYDLFIRPDTCNPRFRVWFNFTVENVKSDQRVIFNIVNFSKTKSLYRDGMTPMVKSTSRPKWVRVPSKFVYYYRCPDHRKNYVMSFAFVFDREEDTYQFAYCYPYSYTRLQNYLDNLEKRNYDFFTRELLCLTVQQRRLDLLTIASPDLYAGENEKLKTVLITARVHPGETPSSFVCQGIIDFLVSNHPIAKILRDHLVFKIVPMLNPDGVYLGNYRCSLMGFDLNRHWQEPSPWAHPTLYATKNLLMELDRNQKHDMDFYIDLHAHSTLMNGFMYGNIYDDTERYEKQSVFPKLLCSNAEDFSLTNTNFNRDAVKAGTGRRTLGSCLDESHCYTLEVSFFSYQTNSTGQSMPYTEEAYMKLGRNVARTFLDYYKLMGYISVKPSSSLVPKPAPSNAPRHSERGNGGERAPSEPMTKSQGDTVYNNSSRSERRDDRFNQKPSEFMIPSANIYPEMTSGVRINRDGRHL
ncbi:cytosolic carboxypeptidase 6-like [Physella acuta]|uniref:cytosolic carboxypeptidase 6-like n=1 Tax=Physella acuta TaxID=109671 RepID=UPI0027DBF631|nr:cytosolic carboxypeptidase 6-like [Physella acuta]